MHAARQQYDRYCPPWFRPFSVCQSTFIKEHYLSIGKNLFVLLSNAWFYSLRNAPDKIGICFERAFGKQIKRHPSISA